MADLIDPETLLDWLQNGVGEDREVQLMALEQLCMLLLMSDNIDRCFESCPPRTFLPALCRIFQDEDAPPQILEVTARAITYYLDVSAECTRRIVAVDGAVKAICRRLSVAEMHSRTGKDLAEQCMKALEFICTREATSVFDAGGLQSALAFVRSHASVIHKDTLHSSMAVITRLCGKLEPGDASLSECVQSLSSLLYHEDAYVCEAAVRCFAAIAERYMRKGADPAPLAQYGLVEYLLGCLRTYGHHQSSSVAPSSAQSTPVQPSKSGAGSASATPATPGTGGDKSASSVSLVISLLSTLCRASGTVTRQLLESDLSSAVENTIYKDERCCLDTIRLVDLLLVLLFEGRKALPKFASVFAAAAAHRQSSYGGVAISRSESERAHRQLIDVIRARDNEAFRILMDQGRIDVNFMDDVGQTLLNWASAFGTAEMVDYLCQRGADVNRGQRSSSLHYAACFGRPNVAKILLRFGANTDLRDEDGKTALERSRERADQGHRDVCAILESPAEWLSSEESSALAFSSPLSAAAAPKLPTPPVAQHPAAAAASVVVGAKRNRSPGFVVSISNDPALRGRRTVTATPAEPPPAQESPQAEDLDSSSGNPDDEVENSPPTPVPEDTIGSPQTPKAVEEPIPEEPLDAALATKYVGRFLPMFCRLYQHSLMTTVRRGSLGLIKKLVRYAEPDALCGICRENHFAEQMVEVLSLVLDTEEDEDSQAGVLTVMQDLLAKNKAFFLEHFARLGIFEKVLALTKLQVGGANAMDSPLTPRTLGVDTAIPFSSTALTATPTGYRAHPRGGDLGAVAAAPVQEDAREIECDVAYHWKDWCIVRGRDCVYMWNEMIALELSNGSNGWFRFIVDSKLGTMYSSGSPEGGSDGSENRSEFLDKLQRARSSLKAGVVSIPILSAPSAVSIMVANWVLESSRAGELYLKNVDGPQQTVLLREDSPSFEFVDNRGVKHVLTAETALGAQFPNWSGSLGRPKPKRVKSRTEVQLAKVVTLAKELYETYFADAQCNFPMQEVMINLQKLVDRFSGLVEAAKSGQEVHGKSFKEALIELKRLLSDEQALSSYELYSSGIIPVLNSVFALAKSNPGLSAIFSEVMFSSAAGSYDEDSNVGPLSTIVLLVRKLVAALELVETLPLYAYDGTGSAFGLQLLIRRLRFRLERARGETRLLDQSGKCLKMEPLATVGQLRRHLSKVVAKQWYDQERSTFQFLKILKESPCGLTFEYQKDFDENGLIYWIGTNGRAVGEWINPAQYGIVQVSSSEGRTLPYGRVEDILSRDNCSLNCHTQDDKKAWFTIDLGLYLIPSAYTLRHARGYARSALRNWLFLGSQDGSKWTTIYVHMEETRLNEPGSTATWVLNPPPSDEKGWRYFRIQQNGKNSSGQTHYLSLSGFEIYGVVTEAAIDMNSASKTPSDPNAKKQPRRSQRQRYNNLNLSAAVRAVRGGMVPAESLWKYAPNELSRAAAGDVAGARSGENVQNAWADLLWDNANTGSSSLYQFAASGESSDFELAYAAMQSQEAALQALHALTVRPQAAAATSNGGGAQHHTPLSRTLRAMAAHKSGGGRGSFGRPPGEGNASVLTSRKSMSTTNLFEVSDDPDRGVSVASTEQAASADNLRNHTPSLENLLARSRLREESMPLTFSGMRLMPESIAESRVEDLAMSGATSDETLAGPGIPLMDIDQAIAELGGEGGGEITPRLEEAGLMDHDAQVAENVAQAIVSQASQESGMFLPTPPPPPPVAAFPPLSGSDDRHVTQALTDDGRSLFESSDMALASLHGGDQMTATQFWSGGGEAAMVQAAVRQRLTNLLLSEKNNSFILEQLAGGSNELIDVAASDVANNVRNSLASLSVSAPNLSLANNSSTTRRDSASTDTSTNSGVRTKPTNSVSFCDSETFEGIVQFAINQELNAMGGIIPSSAQSFPSLTSAVAPPVTASHGIAQQSSHVLVNSMGQPLTMMSLVSTSSDSEADFVEASSGKILADVEDDEIAEVEDHENEDDNGEEDYTSEELLEAVIAGRRRNWDEDMVLKAAIPAMIPAFDPRPGRTNINQTSDVEVPKLVNEALDAVQRSVSVESADSRSLRLQVNSPGLSSSGDAVLSLDDPDRPIFYYVQKLIQHADARGKSEKSRQLWDATYVVAYSSQPGEPATEILVQIDDCPATPSASQGSAATTSGVSDPQGKRSGANLAETLGLLSSLHSFHVQNVEAEARAAILEHPGMFFPDNEYIAKKLSLKLVQQLQDPLVVSCTALPDWCDRLVYGYPMLFPFELRQQYFQATAFGMTRAVVWLQEQRDKLFEPATRSAKREEMHEYRVGRIKHERVKAPRSSEQLLPWAETLMIFHADHKAILEIEFENEEGTGLGPTLEFYALFAAELQRKALAMWVCDDDDPFAHHHPRRLSDSEDPSVTPWGQVDLGQGAKPHGYYVRSSGGLFPAAYPQDHPAIGDVLQRFYLLGIFIGKVLLDNRLVDLPLSQPMLKLLVAWGKLGNKGSVAMPTVSAVNYGRLGTEAMREAYEEERGEHWNVQEKALEQQHWLNGLLNIDDLEVIDSQRARFLKDLAELSERRKAILADESLTGFERKAELKMLRIGGRDGTHVDDLGLTFQLNPNSKALGYKHVNLCAGGHEIPLIDVNIDEYVELSLKFYLDVGIQRQMDALRDGINRVLPAEKLSAFSAQELQVMLSGEQCPVWSEEDIIAFTEPKLGYSRDSPGFLRFVEVLVEMDVVERKAFLQFATGCSSLPPGGLANLYPRLTIVRKVDTSDDSFPSVNTCVHYLKLPEYSSKEILRERLLAATKERGFHLN